jgi:hypothetical protein
VSETCMHELAREACALCSPRSTKVPAKQPERKMYARFDSRCPSCYMLIEEGDPIALVDGEWVCQECWS